MHSYLKPTLRKTTPLSFSYNGCLKRPHPPSANNSSKIKSPMHHRTKKPSQRLLHRINLTPGTRMLTSRHSATLRWVSHKIHALFAGTADHQVYQMNGGFPLPPTAMQRSPKGKQTTKSPSSLIARCPTLVKRRIRHPPKSYTPSSRADSAGGEHHRALKPTRLQAYAAPTENSRTRSYGRKLRRTSTLAINLLAVTATNFHTYPSTCRTRYKRSRVSNTQPQLKAITPRSINRPSARPSAPFPSPTRFA